MMTLIAEAGSITLTWSQLIGAMGVLATLLGLAVRHVSRLTDQLQEERQWYKDLADELRCRVDKMDRDQRAKESRMRAAYESLRQSHNRLMRSHKRLRIQYESLRKDYEGQLGSDEEHGYPHVDDLDDTPPDPVKPYDEQISEVSNDNNEPGAA